MGETYNAYQLAQLAGVQPPDRRDSPGATFLLSVAKDWRKATDNDESTDFADRAHAVADAAVCTLESRGIYGKWQVFLDLQVWQEDTDTEEVTSNPSHGADGVLCTIAERLCYALAREED